MMEKFHFANELFAPTNHFAWDNFFFRRNAFFSAAMKMKNEFGA